MSNSAVEIDYWLLDDITGICSNLGKSYGSIASYNSDLNQNLRYSLDESFLSGNEPFGNEHTFNAREEISSKMYFLDLKMQSLEALSNNLKSFCDFAKNQDQEVAGLFGQFENQQFSYQINGISSLSIFSNANNFDSHTLLLQLHGLLKNVSSNDFLEEVKVMIKQFFIFGENTYSSNDGTKARRITIMNDNYHSYLGSIDDVNSNLINNSIRGLSFVSCTALPPFSVLIERYLDGIDDAIERYDAECEKNHQNNEGRTLAQLQLDLETNPNMPDYTEIIDKWVQEQEDYFDSLYWSPDMMPIVSPIYPYLASRAPLYLNFYDRVKTGGEMDIKQEDSWRDAFGFAKPNDTFLYHGQVMDAGTLGNVVYAYIGAKYFPDELLYLGGAAVQVKRYHWQDLIYMPYLDNYGDMDEDAEAIGLGIEWRDEGFPEND